METIEQSRQKNRPSVPAVTGKTTQRRALMPEMEKVIASPERTSPLGLEQYIAGRTLVSGDSPAWNDLFVKLYSRLNKQEPFIVPAVAEPLVVWVMSGEAVVEERDLDGDWVANTVNVGDFFLTRTPTPYEMRWRAIGDAPFQVMHLYLSVPLFERVAHDILGCAAPPELRDISGGKDTQLSHLLALVHQELTAEGMGSQLFIQGLAQSLAVHLIRNYASGEAAEDRQNALSGFKLRRAVAYLEEHLAEPFNLAQLAETVGMSEFHFSRLFKKATGLSPSRYFIRQRVARAQLLLQETDTSIIEIGMSVGYSSPSHFAQVFRRESGLPPSHYRRG
ncbi:helix-turn-helix domain-containing protein (plasmid) [Agrobacterium radiobacter]|nr:AraC family transcriptional regulator [Agrobacterium tumefaciens]KWT81314.1 AraC family transcriptional regulator [Agrobacterium tumefaciens str. B6]MQB27538.1 AraC family transcriptional regulator [Agrobacterium tumefaciens]NTA05960.1 helix-turn-helix transcriptional regulator [Agrobacterium tumefaciens]NTA94957.1 helix-turn-helix transcriptional regulator [Agrobacterium tumefaciens]NTB13606.1 helix-turn-helix transcriptional regulator [Agrobacterium tumefaciens]